MPKPLKVLFLLEDLCYGGTQKQNLELATRLDRQLFQPSILTLTGPTDWDALATESGLTVRHMGASRKVAPLFFTKLGQCLKKLAPDILVPCTALPNIWGRIWGKAMGVPVIVGTCRGGGAPKRQHERALWRLADAIVCNSHELIQVMARLGAPKNRLAFIANGVDTDRFRPPSTKSEAPIITCVARLAKDKDHLTLIRAFAILAARMPEAILELVGEGPEEANLKSFVATLPESINQRVIFMGASSHPERQLAKARVFALASLREGTPNAILEAMACGLPICATAVGGVPELVTPLNVSGGGDGLLSAPGDAPALARNLMTMLDNPVVAGMLGANARSRVERDFSFANMTAKHQELFLRLAREPEPYKG